MAAGVINVIGKRHEQASLKAQLGALLATVDKEKRPFTETERAQADELEARVRKLGQEIDATLAELDRERNAPAYAPEGGHVARRFADMFPGLSAASSFERPADFLAAVHAAVTTGAHDPRLFAAMGGAPPTSGGFAVPSPLAAAWLDSGLEAEVVRPRATVYAMEADTLDIPGFEDYDHSGGSIAGFKAYWQAELASQTPTDGKLRKITLAALKAMVSTQVSNELLADGGQSFADTLERKMAEAVSWTLDDRFLNGTGVGQPLGILNDPALITVSKESAQAASTFVLENALKMYERLYPGGYGRAVWIVNHSVIPQLYGMHLKIKNVAGTEAVGGSLTPYFTIDAKGGMRLLNMPVVVTEKTPALTNKGDVILADISQYAIGLRAEVSLEASRHAGWATDSTHYRAVVRVAGMGTWAKPLTPKGGTTRSWCVALEAR